MRRLLPAWVAAGAIAASPGCSTPSFSILAGEGSARYPDLAGSPPASIYLKANSNKLEIRFSNTILNQGAGPLQVRAQIQGEKTAATQEVLDEAGNVLETKQVGVFEYHPTHHHTHVDEIALYELRRGSPMGEVVTRAKKVSYCLEDAIQVQSGNMPRLYPKCTPELQGISPGWADFYGSEVPDQELRVSGLPEGEYYLLVTIDPSAKFLDANRANNMAWTKIYLDPQTVRVQRLEASSEYPATVTGEGRFWRPFWRGV